MSLIATVVSRSAILVAWLTQVSTTKPCPILHEDVSLW